MPEFLIVHLYFISAVVGLAAFCFSHRDPRNEDEPSNTGEVMQFV